MKVGVPSFLQKGMNVCGCDIGSPTLRVDVVKATLNGVD
jgi:hypothetical protein